MAADTVGQKVPVTSDEKYDHLETRIDGLEQQFSGLRADFGLMRGEVGAIGSKMDGLAEIVKENRQDSKVNPSLWIGMAMMVLVMVGGGSTYIDQVVSPVKEKVASHDLHLGRTADILTQLEKDVGRNEAFVELMQAELLRQDKNQHAFRNRLQVVEKQGAAAEVSRKAIGGYVQELSQRHWKGEQN